MVKPKEKEIILLNQELIDDIHKKHNILIEPTEGMLACKIAVVGENPAFMKKTILVKKTKCLDHAPYGSFIAFRSSAEVDEFESSWAKTFKNYLKKHNAAPFQ
jgi:hypothetical protein